MKFLTATILIFSAFISKTYASQDINLQWDDVTQSEKFEHVVKLDHLQSQVPYTVDCTIFNGNDKNVGILLSPRLLPTTQYSNVMLNKHFLPENHGQLIEGNNQLSFNIVIQHPDNSNYNQFTLSTDIDSPAQITQCTAKPITLESKKVQQIQQIDGGHFFAFNDTNRPVTISVGNFFPTKYDIAPHDYKFVMVSSDNQNIHVVG